MKYETITLVKNNKVVSVESKLVEMFRNFGNIFQNLGIHGLTNIYLDNDTVTIRKTTAKNQNHSNPNIKVIREGIDSNYNFFFDLINPECISKIINNLDASKATQQGDIPTKVIKNVKTFFHILFPQALTMLWIRANFQTNLNLQISNQSIKKNQIKKIKRPVNILPNLSKILNVLCMINLKITLIRNCQNISVDLEKVSAHNIAY